jgi:hypothetical protein
MCRALPAYFAQQGRETHRQSAAATIPLVPHRQQKPSLSKKHTLCARWAKTKTCVQDLNCALH